MEHQLDAAITVLLISRISSTYFGQTNAHFRSARLRFFNTTYGIMSVGVAGRVSERVAGHYVYGVKHPHSHLTHSAQQQARKPCLPQQQDIIPYVV
jgi:hypothetical protein